MRRLFLLLYALLTSVAWAQNGYTISGTVVAETTGKPLRHVLVTIRAARAKAPLQFSFLTSDDGRFVFSNLPAAKFSLIAQRQGTISELFHQNGSYSTAIVTGPGMNSENIQFPLIVFGSISGAVVDENGEPVRDAQIWLFRRVISSGKLQIEMRQNSTTGSSGVFRFGQVIPGTFLIAVSARPWYSQNGMFGFNGAANVSTPPEFDVAYPITYSGGSTDPNAASPITVTAGASASVEIALHPLPAVHVLLSGAEIENGNGFNAYVAGPGGQTLFTNATIMSGPDGLELTGIPSGRYIIGNSSGARKMVNLDSGKSTLDAHALPESTLSGRLTFEGGEHAVEPQILLSNDRQVLPAEIAQDGSFEFTGVPPGHYSLQLPNADEYYIKSVVVGDRPAPDDQLDIAEGSAMKISVIVAKGLSSLDGVAFKDGAPFAGAMVLLFPQNLARASLIRRDQSDSDGSFTLPNVPAGRYTLLAIDDGRDFAYAEPGAIKPYLSGGEIIDVPLAKDARLTAKVQHRQP